MQLEAECCDGEILIRDIESDNHDIMCVIPLTGDFDYDKDVLGPFINLVCVAPSLLRTLEKMVDLFEPFGYETTLFATAKSDIERANSSRV